MDTNNMIKSNGNAGKADYLSISRSRYKQEDPLNNTVVLDEFQPVRKQRIHQVLFGLIALSFVGGLLLSSDQNHFLRSNKIFSDKLELSSGADSLPSPEVGLLGTTAKIEVKEMQLASLYSAGPFRQCPGEARIDKKWEKDLLETPPPNFTPPPKETPGTPYAGAICEGNGAIANEAAMGLIGIIKDNVIDNDDNFKIVMGAITGLAIPLGPAAALMLLVISTGTSLICETDGSNNMQRSISDITSIAHEVVKEALHKAAVEELESVVNDAKREFKYGIDMDHLYDYGQRFFDVARDSKTTGVVGMQTSTNAAIMSLMLFEAVILQSRQEGSKECCVRAVETYYDKRNEILGFYEDMKRDFELYKTHDNNARTVQYYERNKWACLFGGYKRQYYAYINGRNDHRIAQGTWGDNVSTWCPSNDEMKNEARKAMEPKVRDFFDTLYRKVFTADIKEFYAELGKKTPYHCMGDEIPVP